MASGIGVTGNATWGGSGLEAHLLGTGLKPMRFTCDYQSDEHDVTAFDVDDTTLASEFINGLRTWRGQIDCQLGVPALGVTGGVTNSTGYAANVYGWSLDIEGDIHDDTAFAATGNWRVFKGGRIRWGGTYLCRLDNTTAPDFDQTSSAITLTLNSERTFSGAVVITGAPIQVQTDSLNLIAYQFRGNGDLTVGGTGTADPVFPDSATVVQTAQTLTLTAFTSKTLAGSALWSRIGINVPHDAPVTAQIQYQGSGALTATWS